MSAISRPVKSPLKVQNSAHEADSPIKKVAKRSHQILDSDEDEPPAEQVTTKGLANNEPLASAEKASMDPCCILLGCMCCQGRLIIYVLCLSDSHYCEPDISTKYVKCKNILLYIRMTQFFYSTW